MSHTENEQAVIQFIQRHRPTLQAGDYNISIRQNVDINKKRQDHYDVTRQFAVRGERLKFQDSDVHACFPPPDSRGDYVDCLPHIVLTSGTLPWERSAGGKTHSPPWLALLLFDETEMTHIQVDSMQLKDLCRGKGWALERGEHETDTCQVLTLPVGLKDIIPGPTDLDWLAHIRKVSDEKKETFNPHVKETEYAVIVGNRLPQPGKKNTVHLVSLEGYHDDTLRKQRYKEIDGRIQLVSLKSWSFNVSNKSRSFKALVRSLDSNALRMPENTRNKDLERILAMGHTLLPHRMRQGDRTVSLYHGPFVPYHAPRDIKLPVTCADELIRYHQGNGLFDVSYAVAWQLGRLLALQNKDVSMMLYQWKRDSRKRGLRNAETERIKDQLGETFLEDDGDDAQSDQDVFTRINTWLGKLKHLSVVPIRHLVPDERMLPAESIRFFTMDMNWIDCLIDGAFSIGRATTGDIRHDVDTLKQISAASDREARAQRRGGNSAAVGTIDKITGIMIRSRIVSVWPGLEFDAYAENGAGPLPIFSMQRLDKDILLCLFEGDINQIDIHEPPEGLHFGVNANKRIKDPVTGNPSGAVIEAVPFRSDDKRVVHIDKLATRIETLIASDQPFTSAEFAMQMINSANKVSFVKK